MRCLRRAGAPGTLCAFLAVSLAMAGPASAQTPAALDSLRTHPDDAALYQGLWERYSTTVKDSLGIFLWQAWRYDLTLSAMDGALQTLESPDPALVRHREDALKILAASLGTRFYDPAVFRESGLAARIHALSLGPELDGAVAELLAWQEDDAGHRTPGFGRPAWLAPDSTRAPCTGGRADADPLLASSDTSWWAQPDTPVIEGALTRREAASRMLRAIGLWYADTPDQGSAEGYFCLAAFLGPKPYQQAFEDLVWVYLDSELLPPIKALHHEYQDQFHQPDLGLVEQTLLRGEHGHRWRWLAGGVVGGVLACVVFDVWPCNGGGRVRGTVIVVPPSAAWVRR